MNRLKKLLILLLLSTSVSFIYHHTKNTKYIVTNIGDQLSTGINSYGIKTPSYIDYYKENLLEKKNKVIINNTYDNYSSKEKERLLKEKNIETLPIYTIETEITTIWNDEIITNEITNIMTSLNNKNITPKNYTITITDKENITKAVKITNLSIKNIENNNLSMIINDIINNKKTNILSENKIAYKYLN